MAVNNDNVGQNFNLELVNNKLLDVGGKKNKIAMVRLPGDTAIYNIAIKGQKIFDQPIDDSKESFVKKIGKKIFKVFKGVDSETTFIKVKLNGEDKYLKVRVEGTKTKFALSKDTEAGQLTEAIVDSLQESQRQNRVGEMDTKFLDPLLKYTKANNHLVFKSKDDKTACENKQKELAQEFSELSASDALDFFSEHEFGKGHLIGPLISSDQLNSFSYESYGRCVKLALSVSKEAIQGMNEETKKQFVKSILHEKYSSSPSSIREYLKAVENLKEGVGDDLYMQCVNESNNEKNIKTMHSEIDRVRVELKTPTDEEIIGALEAKNPYKLPKMSSPTKSSSHEY